MDLWLTNINSLAITLVELRWGLHGGYTHRRNHPMGPVGRVPSKNWEPWDQ